MSNPPAKLLAKAESRGALTGILLILGTMVCFACMDASAKWLGSRLNPIQTIATRYVVSFVLVALFFNPWTKPGVLKTQHLGLQCGRALCLLLATATGWTAVRYLALTQLTSIVFAAPLLVAVLAGPMLGEKLGPRRVIAVCVGFAGVLVVTRPFGGSMHPAALLALLAALGNALYSILTRKLAAHDAPETTMFYTGLVGSVVVLPAVPFVWHSPMEWRVWAVLLALGGFGALAHWLLILAHRYTSASTLAPFYYAQIVGAVIFGFVIFHELPDRWTWTGTAIVIASGLYLFWRERVRQKPVPSADING